jgi:hypothetical protein
MPGRCGLSTVFSSRAMPVPQLTCFDFVSNVPQPWSWPGGQIASGELQFTLSLSIMCTVVSGRLVYSYGH